MDNQHRKIRGYRELSADEIALMNEVKAAGEKLGVLVKKVEDHLQAQYVTAGEMGAGEDQDAEYSRLNDADPYKWLYASTDALQTGIMKLVRAVAQPTTF